MTTVFYARLYCRFIEMQSNPRGKKFHRTNQGSNFLGGSFSSGDNVSIPIQFRRESQLQHLKRFWLNFDVEPRVQVRQQRKDQQSNIFVFVAYLTIPSSDQQHHPRHDSSIPCKAILQIYRDTEETQRKETSQNESRLQFTWRHFQQQR